MGASTPAHPTPRPAAAAPAADLLPPTNLTTVTNELTLLMGRLQDAFLGSAQADLADSVAAVKDAAQAVGAGQTAPPASTPYWKRTDIDHAVTVTDILGAPCEEERIRRVSVAPAPAVTEAIHQCVQRDDVAAVALLCEHYNKANGPLQGLYVSTSLAIGRTLFHHLEEPLRFALLQSTSVCKRLIAGTRMPLSDHTSLLQHQLTVAAAAADFGSFRYFYNLLVQASPPPRSVIRDLVILAARGGAVDIIRFLGRTGFNLGEFRHTAGLAFVVIKDARVFQCLREDLLLTDRDITATVVSSSIRHGGTRAVIQAVKAGHINPGCVKDALQSSSLLEHFVHDM